MYCPHCGIQILVPEDADAADARWLHERRCAAEEALFPEVGVVCAACTSVLPVSDGLDVFETLWMHDLECPDRLGAELVITDAA
jgi:hypothetical protein